VSDHGDRSSASAGELAIHSAAATREARKAQIMHGGVTHPGPEAPARAVRVAAELR
jgi:hypothetical protein